MSENPQNIEVLVLAAGLGTRLRPLTDTVPKPLIEVGGKTLLERAFSQLTSAGFKSIWVNTHHLPEKVRSFVGDSQGFGLKINISHEPTLLDTGGAIANIPALRTASNLLILNSDALFVDPIPFGELIKRHLGGTNIAATLLLKDHPEVDQFGVIEASAAGEVTSFIGHKTASTAMSEGKYLFTGCSLIGAPLLHNLPPANKVFSLTRDLMLDGVRSGYSFNSVLYKGRWIDVGTPERLSEASKLLSAG